MLHVMEVRPMKPLILAALLGLSACASAPSGPDPYAYYDEELVIYREVIAECQAHPEVDCSSYFAEMDVRLDQAEARIEAYEAAQNRRSAGGAALMAVGAGFLGQAARGPVICTTSDTTNATTVCQ
jgi:hypothetical protein